MNFGLATCVEAELGTGPGEVEFPAPTPEMLAAARAEQIHEVMGLDVAGTDHFRAVFAIRSHGAPALLVGEGSVLEFRPGDTFDNLEVRLIAPAEWSTAIEVALGPDLGRVLSR
ncbi:MAG: hypothetical protein NDI82_01780 [Anaeromyxobacteraceae bacterium]|nr:hypothetical protein [Anaeromyxobacteraceae bacterium]